MSVSETVTLEDLIASLFSDLNDRKAEILADVNPTDEILSLVDAWTPIHYGELIQCLSADTKLGFPEYSFTDATSVFDIISANIRQELEWAGLEWFQEAEKRAEEDE